MPVAVAEDVDLHDIETLTVDPVAAVAHHALQPLDRLEYADPGVELDRVELERDLRPFVQLVVGIGLALDRHLPATGHVLEAADASGGADSNLGRFGVHTHSPFRLRYDGVADD